MVMVGCAPTAPASMVKKPVTIFGPIDGDVARIGPRFCWTYKLAFPPPRSSAFVRMCPIRLWRVPVSLTSRSRQRPPPCATLGTAERRSGFLLPDTRARQDGVLSIQIHRKMNRHRGFRSSAAMLLLSGFALAGCGKVDCDTKGGPLSADERSLLGAEAEQSTFKLTDRRAHV